ncbi:hypothetical protein Pcinc_043912 [Petrolisthes cinctipes]|uniref:Uncharacterized protein n=1 Tax=Petrolisthes cinctipes TaxID=88211 RepID=A0AAE1EFV0_PETCI|nr:hypothetical protein Pcinc_043912 [Petrolisthes cinctipes]
MERLAGQELGGGRRWEEVVRLGVFHTLAVHFISAAGRGKEECVCQLSVEEGTSPFAQGREERGAGGGRVGWLVAKGPSNALLFPVPYLHPPPHPTLVSTTTTTTFISDPRESCRS